MPSAAETRCTSTPADVRVCRLNPAETIHEPQALPFALVEALVEAPANLPRVVLPLLRTVFQIVKKDPGAFDPGGYQLGRPIKRIPESNNPAPQGERLTHIQLAPVTRIAITSLWQTKVPNENSSAVTR